MTCPDCKAAMDVIDGQGWCEDPDCLVIVVLADGTAIREGDEWQVQRVGSDHD